MRFSINKERAWGMNTVFKLKVQRYKVMHTQYEVNNSSKQNFLSKLNFLCFSIAWNCPIYSLQNRTKGSSRNVSSIWKAKDHRSTIMTWKPNINFHFLAQILIYTGRSGVACIYACCIVCKMHTCGKIFVFSSRSYKQG
jgi:hypothetical protein